MGYATAILRGREIDISYRILEYCGGGWVTEWDFMNAGDKAEIGPTITAEEEDAVNDALIVAEGNR